MENIIIVEKACNIAQAIVTCAEALALIQNIPLEDSKNDSQLSSNVSKLHNRLLSQLSLIQFVPLENNSVLSNADKILANLANGFEQLVVRLGLTVQENESTSTRNGTNGNGNAKIPTFEDMAKLLDTLRADLNTGLGRDQWRSISDAICELGGRNNRMEANRTTEIQTLESQVDFHFKQITSSSVGDVENAKLWLQIPDLLPKIMDIFLELSILAALQFWTMSRRKESIEKEHQDTFKWALADSNTNQSGLPSDPQHIACTFPQWLKSSNSLYWISGKPGSGKSTLIKYIAESPATLDMLKTWAKDDQIIIADFYFWSSAKDPLQKSGTGLMRSILFQILRECPNLIQYAYPTQWQERYQSEQSTLWRLTRSEHNTVDLLDAFHRVSESLSSTKSKFCFFIDGLDEYDGKPADVIQLIESLQNTTNIKTCMSSRQWAEFESKFGGDNPWKLYIHEKTKTDMEKYVRDQFHQHPQFSQFETANEATDIKVLLDRIVENAQGVFLWSFLVVRDLLDGLNEEDSLAKLQSKLAVIPNDLDGYFAMLFESTNESIRENTAIILQITLDAVEKLPLLSYWFIEQSILGTSKQLHQSAPVEIVSEITTFLQKYSRGLLKSKGFGNKANETSEMEIEQEELLFGFRVDFIHRTVADFLQTDELRGLLRKWSTKSVNADTEICKASLAIIKATPPIAVMFRDASLALSMLHVFMSHAKGIELNVQVGLVGELGLILEENKSILQDLPMMILGPGNYWAYNANFNFIFLYYCVSYGLGEYVVTQLKQKPTQFSENSSGLLCGFFAWDPRVRMGKFGIFTDALQALLVNGLDPNCPWGDRAFSFWEQLLTSTYSKHVKGIADQSDRDAIKLAIQHGADIKSDIETVGGRGSGTSATSIVEKLLQNEHVVYRTTNA